MEYDRARLRGVILEEGSLTAHVTIVAKALDIPMVGRVAGALAKIEPGDRIALDGEHGQIFLRAGEDVELAFARSIEAREARRRAYATLREQPAITVDGIRVGLHLNAAFLIDLAALETTGTDGIGLYRTELSFMVRDQLPDVHPRPSSTPRRTRWSATSRWCFAPWMSAATSTCPTGASRTRTTRRWAGGRCAWCWTGRRSCAPSCAPCCAARQGRSLDVMFPMVAEVAEFEAARRLLDMELERARRAGPGAAIAAPRRHHARGASLFWHLPALLPRVDFLSIGSNDLMQFMFACDRGNPELVDRYDVLSPPVLSFLRELVERCRRAGVTLSICGEMASRPLEAMVLLGLGVRQLS